MIPTFQKITFLGKRKKNILTPSEFVHLWKTETCLLWEHKGEHMPSSGMVRLREGEGFLGRWCLPWSWQIHRYCLGRGEVDSRPRNQQVQGKKVKRLWGFSAIASDSIEQKAYVLQFWDILFYCNFDNSFLLPLFLFSFLSFCIPIDYPAFWFES